VLLRLVVNHPDKKALELFARELGSIGLSCAPGTTGIFSGRPKPTPIVRLFTFYVDKAALAPPRVQIGDQPAFDVPVPTAGARSVAPSAEAAPATAPGAIEPMAEVPLLRIAWARSGDKGDSANIGIIARDQSLLEVIRREVTPERMRAHFAGEMTGSVRRYEAPGLGAFNYVLEQALGGGGMASMRIDPQGKAYGQRALEMMVRVPVRLLAAAAL
jgi:hypothetical protein